MQSKQHIDKLINIFLTDLTNRHIEDNAGWKCDSIMSLLIDYEGDIPQFTGGDQSNLSMIIAVMDMRDEHHELKLIKSIVNYMLGHPRHNPNILSLLSWRYHTGQNEATGQAYTDLERMDAIGYWPMYNEAPDKAVRRFKDRARSAVKFIDDRLIINEAEAA
jgi:hypothetical protein